MFRDTLVRRLLAALLVALLSLPLRAPGETAPGVDLLLVLAVDCSYSVDDEEYRLQMQGIARALTTREVIGAIAGGDKGRIAITLLHWSSVDDQHVVLPWTIVADAASAARAARVIAAAPRSVSFGSTSISAAIDASVVLLLASPLTAPRSTIDVAADGFNNNGAPPEFARDRAVRLGITINGLTILNEVFYLEHYFRNHVVGGSGHFIEIAAGYEDFAEAMRKKLLREIEVPAV